MDVIEHTDVIKKLTGRVFLSTHEAVTELTQVASSAKTLNNTGS